jgi:sulfur-oxidizing protein SoxY
MGMIAGCASIDASLSLEGRAMPGSTLLRVGAVVLLSALLGVTAAAAAEPESYDPWPGLVQDIFDSRSMEDGSSLITLDMPARAEDAAIVPVTLRVKPTSDANLRVVAITLVIDQNPAPMAARFRLGADAHVSEISTRVRVNGYGNVHAVAETSDGKLFMVKTYVKASGGCSAPAAKNAEEAKGRLGQIRYRPFAKMEGDANNGAREAQVMIGHPNNSGLQMDQVTQLYVPAFYVDHVQLWQDDSPVLSMDGGISISEDPNIRFTYVSNGARSFRVEAKDTEGHQFKREWKVDGSSM